ncbi:hypothetical protein MNBD_BACTEROID03-2224 [hydrothermal vent metagenome]|uniref:Amidohydrolase-related domain-containing protein n=1 Tax=hydrothermal vent metagenome TaxID=652676 RepID=A0A3B0TCE9_9ZZZZ
MYDTQTSKKDKYSLPLFESSNSMKIYIALAAVLFMACSPTPLKDSLLIEGATLINPGNSTEIIESSFLYIENGKIESYGTLTEKPNNLVPEKTIDARGKYLMPGLIDGFATLNNQAYANAYLYKGVTTILEVDGYRRGPFYADADPKPGIYRLEGVGEEPTTDTNLIAKIDSLHAADYKVLLMMYALTPDQTKMVYEHAKSLGMATIGEMGLTTYKQGMDIGLDAFVHTTRYSLDIAPRDMANAVANNPFSNDLESPKWKYYGYLTQVQKNDSLLMQHAKNLAASHSFIMPTMSLSYLDLPEAKNPWLDPVAAILNPEDINRPADPKTGKHNIGQEEQTAYSNLIANETSVIEPAYYKAGARYLSGSATDVWGTMPGISLHTELMLLHTKAGLTNAEVLAATTSNFSDAFRWKVGKIQAGFEADLLLLNANPLESLSNLTTIYKLFIDGKELIPETLLKQTNDH